MKRMIRASFDNDMDLMADAASWVDHWVDLSDARGPIVLGVPAGYPNSMPIIRITRGYIEITKFDNNNGNLVLDTNAFPIRLDMDMGLIESRCPPEVVDMVRKGMDAFSGAAKARDPRSRSRRPGTAVAYTFWVCNNEQAASRGGPDPDTFQKYRKQFTSDDAAFEFAASLIYGEDWAEWGDAYDIVADQDPGAGWPVVYGIARGRTWLYQDPDFGGYEAQRVDGE